MIELSHVTKSYETNRGPVVALDDVSLRAERSEIVCILGPSGGGKTTILNLMAGLERPTSGRVACDGQPVLIFQELALFPWLTAAGNAAFGLRMAGVPRDERDRRVRRALELVHLRSFENAYVHQLSGGMKQRVALARALVLEPRVLLLDEPFAALDPETRDAMLAQLEEIWRATQATIVFVTHNVREAVCLGDRVLLLSARPGRRRGEYRVDLPRPRGAGDRAVSELVATIHADMRGEEVPV